MVERVCDPLLFAGDEGSGSQSSGSQTRSTARRWQSGSTSRCFLPVVGQRIAEQRVTDPLYRSKSSHAHHQCGYSVMPATSPARIGFSIMYCA